MGLGLLSHVSSNAVPVDMRRAGSRGRRSSWRAAHERRVWGGQGITVPVALGRSRTITRKRVRIKGCPAVVARRKRIWVSGVGLEGEIEGGWRGTTHEHGWGGGVVRHLLDVLGGSTGGVVHTGHGFA